MREGESEPPLRRLVRLLPTVCPRTTPASEHMLELEIYNGLTALGWLVRPQVKARGPGSLGGRYDLLCHPPGDREDAARPIVVELKLKIQAGHYRQIDRYLQTSVLPLIVAGWHAAPTALQELERLSQDAPGRFAVVVFDKGASLA